MPRLGAVEPSELIGSWRFARAIHDRSSDADYDADGAAEFAALVDGSVRWSERGVLSWDGGSTPVERTLFLVPRDGKWMVTFDDGREFHPWTARAVSHWCAPDSYSGVLSARSGVTDAWSLTWTVEGPHKNYTMATTYRRAC